MPSWPHAAAAPHPLLRFMPKYAAGSVAMTTPRLSMLRRWQRYRDRGGGCRRLAALLVQGAAAGGRAPDSTCTPYTQHPAHAAAATPPPHLMSRLMRSTRLRWWSSCMCHTVRVCSMFSNISFIMPCSRGSRGQAAAGGRRQQGGQSGGAGSHGQQPTASIAAPSCGLSSARPDPTFRAPPPYRHTAHPPHSQRCPAA